MISSNNNIFLNDFYFWSWDFSRFNPLSLQIYNLAVADENENNYKCTAIYGSITTVSNGAPIILRSEQLTTNN
jgi:hypothetical protein